MTFRVFLSSTGADLQDYRDAAYEAIRMTGATCVRMEDFEADPRPPAVVCEEAVAGSDMLVGLIGFHFGGRVPPKQDRSFTQVEIDAARNVLPSFFYVAPDRAVPATDQSGQDLDAQRALRDRLLAEHTVGRPEHWESPYRLALQIMSVVFRAMPSVSPKEQYAARLRVEILDRDQRYSAADPFDKEDLQKEKEALEMKLENIDSSFKNTQTRVYELENLLEHDEKLQPERLEVAEAALRVGDFDAADRLLAEVEVNEQVAVERAARAAFGRAHIAEETVRWREAAAHYARAAALDPTFDHVRGDWQFCWKLGDYDRALIVADRLYKIATQEYGKVSLNAAIAVGCKAIAFKMLERHDEAGPLYFKAVDICERAVGKKHEDFAIALNNLARFLADTERYEEAEILYEESIELGVEIVGLDHPSIANRLSNFARLLLTRNRLKEAEDRIKLAIEIDKKSLDDHHPQLGAHLNVFANLLKSQERYDEAIHTYEQMLDVDRVSLGTKHPEVRQRASDFAELLRKRYPDDERLKVLRRTFGPDIGT